MGVVGERMHRELYGTACLRLHDGSRPNKTIISSRTFGAPVTAYTDVAQAIASFMHRAAEKLRRQQSVAGYVRVSIRTSPFKRDETYYSNSAGMVLPQASHYTPTLTTAAHQLLERIFVPGHHYKRAAVMLADIRPAAAMQLNLLAPRQPLTKQRNVMQALDAINQRFGRKSLFYASEGFHQRTAWQPRQSAQSPHYTTRWSDLPVVQARQ